MSEKLTCRKCGTALKRPKTGRPPVWCSTACRRSAEYEIKRVNRRLEALESQLDRLVADGDIGLRYLGGRTHKQQKAGVQTAINRNEERLRALLEE